MCSSNISTSLEMFISLMYPNFLFWRLLKKPNDPFMMHCVWLGILFVTTVLFMVEVLLRSPVHWLLVKLQTRYGRRPWLKLLSKIQNEKNYKYWAVEPVTLTSGDNTNSNILLASFCMCVFCFCWLYLRCLVLLVLAYKISFQSTELTLRSTYTTVKLKFVKCSM